MTEGKLTVLVNTCDTYCDLWEPFFKLFNIYGEKLKRCKIVLNTETKIYKYQGLNIQCFSMFDSDESKKIEWGRRLRKTLEKIESDYILFLLDDFFLHRTVNSDFIFKCIEWMETDSNIGCMNLLPLDYVNDKSIYEGFCLAEPGIEYRINAQACIWRKRVLYNSILDIESPWHWELYGNLRNDVLMKSKVYTLKWGIKEPFFYDYYEYGKLNAYGGTKGLSAVTGGKWNLDVIKDIFRKNNINIDYSVRGIHNEYHRIIPRNNKFARILLKPYRQYKNSKIELQKLSIDYDERLVARYVTPYLSNEKF